MAPRQRVCHSVANARLISRLRSPGVEKDVPCLPVNIFSTNRGHSVFSKNNQPLTEGKKKGKNSKWREKKVIRMLQNEGEFRGKITLVRELVVKGEMTEEMSMDILGRTD